MHKEILEFARLFEERCVVTEPSDMAKYLADLQGITPQSPLAVFRPSTTQQASQMVKWCHAHKLDVVPQGGLTGLCTAAVPMGNVDVVIIAFDRLNKIREVDALNNSITVDAGVVLGDLKRAAEDVDRYFPLTHGAVGSSQIGGNLSTNSGGINAIKYGTARDQVLGLEVVLPDGTIWNGLRRLRKNTSGYDLKHLFLGAEGTLGLITGAVLKLRPIPRNRATAFLGLATPQIALNLLRKMETYVGDTLVAFELISATAADYAKTIEGGKNPLETKSNWYVLVEVETSSKYLDIDAAFEAGLAEAIEQGDIEDAVIAQSVAQRDAFWALREAVAVSFVEDKDCVKGDTAVPVSAISEYLENTKTAVEKLVEGIRVAPFGHLGDGNIHFNVARPADMDGAEFRQYWDDIKHIVETEALKLDGTISAEHGIGTLKLKAFLANVDETEKDLMQRIRSTIDPDRGMNPSVLM